MATLALLATLLLTTLKKDLVGLDKKENNDCYITNYKIGGTIYEVETSFSGTETLNNKIIRLMLSEKFETKGADNSEKARYNSNIHSVLPCYEKEEFDRKLAR